MAAELLSFGVLGRQTGVSIVVTLGRQAFFSTIGVVGRTEVAGGLSPVGAEIGLVCTFRSAEPVEKSLKNFYWLLQKVADCACEGSEGFELFLDERQIHVCLLCEVRTLARRCLRICRHPIGRHSMYLVTIGSLFKGKTEKSF